MDMKENNCVGIQFKLKREEKLLTLDDVAEHLRLKKTLINDIENGNYHQIPPTYLKGYLRSYAKLLAISDFDMIDTLNFAENQNSNNGWKVFTIQKQISASDKRIQWITYSIISTLVILVTLWWESDNLLNKSLTYNEAMPQQGGYTVAKNDFK